jgi:hypothetical protein
MKFVVGVWRMMLAVMLVRPSCDQIFDWVKVSFDQNSGTGAAITCIDPVRRLSLASPVRLKDGGAPQPSPDP